MQASDWDARYTASDLVWSAGPNVFVERECAGLAPGRALDLGSGEGRNALWLASRGWAVTAVDYSAVASQRAAARARASNSAGSVVAVTADVLSYQPDSGSFDLVLLAYLQLPLVERRAVLGTAVGALAPGGTLLVVAHHGDNIAYGVGGPDNPAVLFTEADVIADLLDLSSGDRADLDDLDGLGDLVVELAGKERRAVGPAPEAGHQHGVDRTPERSGGATDAHDEAGPEPGVRHALDVVVRARRVSSS